MSLLKKLAITGVSLFLIGCATDKKDDNKEPPKNPYQVGENIGGGTVLGDNTFRLKPSQVLMYNPETGDLKLNVNPDLNFRSIIFVDSTSDSLPNGLLRRVRGFGTVPTYSNKSQSSSSSDNIIYTNPVSITEAFRDLDFHKSFDINNSFTFEKIIFDEDNNPSTTDDNVTIKGKINVDTHTDFTLNTIYYSVQNLIFSTNGKIKFDAEITVGENLRYRYFNIQRDLGSILLPPLTVPGLILNPKIGLSTSFKGKTSVKTKTNFKLSDTITINSRINYNVNSDWSTTENFTNNFSYSLSEVENANADLEASIEPKLSVMAYNLAGVYSSVKGGFKFVADTDKVPWWTLDAFLKGYVGLDSAILHSIEYNKEIYNKNFPLAQAKDSEDDESSEEPGNLFDQDFLRLTDGDSPAWSHDGKNLAYIKDDEIYVYNLSKKIHTKISSLNINNSQTAFNIFWSPEDNKLGFISSKSGNNEIYTIDAKTESVPKQLTYTSRNEWTGDWLGNKIVFDSTEPNDFWKSSISIINEDGTGLKSLTTNSDYYSSYSPKFGNNKILFLSEKYSWSSSVLSKINLDGTQNFYLLGFSPKWYDFSISEDNSSIIYSTGLNYTSQINLHNLNNNTSSTLYKTSGQTINLNGSLHPSNKWIVFESDQDCSYIQGNYICSKGIYIKNVKDLVNQ